MNTLSGVGVIDKAMAVIGALESGPRTLAQLVEATGLERVLARQGGFQRRRRSGLVRRDCRQRGPRGQAEDGYQRAGHEDQRFGRCSHVTSQERPGAAG